MSEPKLELEADFDFRYQLRQAKRETWGQVKKLMEPPKGKIYGVRAVDFFNNLYAEVCRRSAGGEA